MDSMPIITLEVMQDSSLSETVLDESFYNDIQQTEPDTKDSAEMNFLTAKCEEIESKDQEMAEAVPPVNDFEENGDSLRIRSDLLEYTTGNDGSVICKLCGKLLASRQHWYRHKYRAHVMAVTPTPPTPASLFQCEQCSIYFKSRKGYIGHIASRHSETLQDVSPVLTNAQAEALAREKDQQALVEVKKEPDPELSIPKTIVPTYQAHAPTKQNKSTETKEKKAVRCRAEPTNDKDWEKKRSQEEKLVADIIARVRRECEAQGPGPARRGYSRKSAAMRT